MAQRVWIFTMFLIYKTSSHPSWRIKEYVFYFSLNNLQFKRTLYTIGNLQDYFKQAIQTSSLGKDDTLLGFNITHTISTQDYSYFWQVIFIFVSNYILEKLYTSWMFIIENIFTALKSIFKESLLDYYLAKSRMLSSWLHNYLKANL